MAHGQYDDDLGEWLKRQKNPYAEAMAQSLTAGAVAPQGYGEEMPSGDYGPELQAEGLPPPMSGSGQQVFIEEPRDEAAASETFAPSSPQETKAVGEAPAQPKDWLGALLKRHSGQLEEESAARRALKGQAGAAQDQNRLRGLGAGITASILSFARDPQAAAWLERAHKLSAPAAVDDSEFKEWLAGRKSMRGAELEGAKLGAQFENQAKLAEEARKAKLGQDELNAEQAKLTAATKFERDVEMQKLRDQAAGERVKTLAGAAAGARSTARSDKEDRELERQAEEYGKGIGGMLPEIRQRLAAVQALIPEKGDIPGVGLVDANLPDVLSKESAINMRQNVDALVNLLLRKETGAVIAPSEVVGKKRELGLQGGDEKAFRLGIPKLIQQLEAKERAEMARFRPAAVQLYNERRGLAEEAGSSASGPVDMVDDSGKVWSVEPSQMEAFRRKNKNARQAKP